MRREGNIVRYSAEEIRERIARGEDRTDWERVRSMSDEEIEANVDEADEGVPDFSKIYIGIPGITGQLMAHYDQDIVDWFLAQGPGYPRLMNEALRDYIRQQEKMSSAAD